MRKALLTSSALRKDIVILYTEGTKATVITVTDLGTSKEKRTLKLMTHRAAEKFQNELVATGNYGFFTKEV